MTSWTVARQAPLSMEFSRQEYWSGLPLPSPGALPNPGMEPASPALAGRVFTAEPPGKPVLVIMEHLNRCSLTVHGINEWLWWLSYEYKSKFF